MTHKAKSRTSRGPRSLAVSSTFLIVTAVIILRQTLTASFRLSAPPRNSRLATTSSRKLITMASTQNDASSTTNPLSELGLPEPILLGSASFTRKLILKEMNIPFHKVVRPIDEKALGDRSQDPPKELVLTLANAKMDHLVKEFQAGNIGKDELPPTSSNEFIFLTGDQVVTCQGNILEKPESLEEAKQFVAQYGLHPPSTVGSCVLHHVPSNIRVAGVDTATIYFKESLSNGDAASKLVDSLVKQEEPVLSCAGGLMIEHPEVQEYVEKIDGTQDSVMGLSKPLVEQLLKEMADKLKAQ